MRPQRKYVMQASIKATALANRMVQIFKETEEPYAISGLACITVLRHMLNDADISDDELRAMTFGEVTAILAESAADIMKDIEEGIDPYADDSDADIHLHG